MFSSPLVRFVNAVSRQSSNVLPTSQYALSKMRCMSTTVDDKRPWRPPCHVEHPTIQSQAVPYSSPFSQPEYAAGLVPPPDMDAYDGPAGIPNQLDINAKMFSFVINHLTDFFRAYGFSHAHVQHLPSRVSACEDPTTVGLYYAYDPNTGTYIPMPMKQTNQMDLEKLLLRQGIPKSYTLTTSYRFEPKADFTRRWTQFPMFEFESVGNFNDLIVMLRKLIQSFGYSHDDIRMIAYRDACKLFDVLEIGDEEENNLAETLGCKVVLLYHFPTYTHTFWNMKTDLQTGFAHKVDVIWGGQETIGGAERETSPDIMWDRFNQVEDGKYRDNMYRLFTQRLVDGEVREDYLTWDFVPRYGAGMGVVRLLNALHKDGKLPSSAY